MAMHQDFQGFEHLHDARILTEDGFTFPVHRVLLALKSEYFHDLLCNASVAEEEDIFVPGIRGPTMEIVLHYIYTGKVNLVELDKLPDVLVAASYLGIENLLVNSRNLAVRSLTTTNCVPLFLAALKIEKLGLLKACSRFITSNFRDLVWNHNSTRFGDLPRESLEEFLALDNLDVSGEDQVWTAIASWIGEDPEERTVYLRDMLRHVRFGEASGDYGLASEILDHPLAKRDGTKDAELERWMAEDRFPISTRSRIPESFFVFTKDYMNLSDYSEGIKVYVTFDDQIDVWKRVGSKIFCPDVVLHAGGPLVAMFETTTTTRAPCTFDVLSRTWSSLDPPAAPRRGYSVVKLRDRVYVLGGRDDSDEAATVVERYDFVSQRWESVPSLCAFSDGSAVATSDDSICFIGSMSGFFGDFLVAQIHEFDSDVWRTISGPSVFRLHFALVDYRDRLFVLGGHDHVGIQKSVEVYSAAENEWKTFQDLPFPYFSPKATVIKDILYVYDMEWGDVHGEPCCPPVFWDEASGKWEVVEPTSPFCDLQMYQFCAVDDPEVIRALRRDTDAQWEGSPFFAYLNTPKDFP